MITQFFVALILTWPVVPPSYAGEAEHEHEHEHEEQHAHEEKDHADESEESRTNVGPDKGFTEANEAKGFKLSPEAFKNFEIKLSKLEGRGPWTVPANVVVHSGEEANLFRMREGFFKSIDFIVSKRTASSITFSSKDLREGDEIVVHGVAYLKVAELAASGGVAHSHSH